MSGADFIERPAHVRQRICTEPTNSIQQAVRCDASARGASDARSYRHHPQNRQLG
jgi:hypothetical protein